MNRRIMLVTACKCSRKTAYTENTSPEEIYVTLPPAFIGGCAFISAEKIPVQMFTRLTFRNTHREMLPDEAGDVWVIYEEVVE